MSTGMAVDCPNQDPFSGKGNGIEMYRQISPGAFEIYLILEGVAPSGKHRCCWAKWPFGDGQLQKWCPDMAPLQI